MRSEERLSIFTHSGELMVHPSHYAVILLIKNFMQNKRQRRVLKGTLVPLIGNQSGYHINRL